jgi:hypothetical protein
MGNRAIQRLKESVHKLWDARQSKTSQQLSQQQGYESSMGKTEKAERALTWLDARSNGMKLERAMSGSRKTIRSPQRRLCFSALHRRPFFQSS